MGFLPGPAQNRPGSHNRSVAHIHISRPLLHLLSFLISAAPVHTRAVEAAPTASEACALPLRIASLLRLIAANLLILQSAP